MRYVEVSPGRIELRTGAPSTLRLGSVRVAVQACGLCGTDLHAVRGMVLPRGVEYPVRPGHEVSGVVTEIGEGVDPRTAPQVGQSVVLHPLAPCGKCDACARGEEQVCSDVRTLGFHYAGGLADEVVWPADRMVPVDGVPSEQAALLADAVATAYHALRYADVPPGGALCVLGAGGLGSQVLRLAHALDPEMRLAAVVRSRASADRVTGLGAAAVRGLDHAIHEVRDAIGRPDAVVDFTGDAAATAVGVRVLRPGGRLVLGSVVDAPADLGTTVTGITAREISVRGAYVSTLEELRTVTRLAMDGDLDLSGAVSDVMPLARADEALRLVDEHPPGLQRLIITPEGLS